jgi:hypothetical protein
LREGSSRVRNLPIRSIPIIRENMPLYDVLNTFQYRDGIAIVIPSVRSEIPRLPSMEVNTLFGAYLDGKENRILGVRCSKITGIVTFDDVIASMVARGPEINQVCP